ncbi:response regulator [Lachnospiraceae bacterium OttesenSCG-928-D06]|nr:response regulator [Lachnospiraceae bacterium OttesenSCG-928-D06]
MQLYRILLVDDEPIILSGIKFLIDWKNIGCELIGTARNGQQALEKIHALHPDIVIADINMPVMDGISLLRETEKNYPNIVFIMLTNLQEFDLVTTAMRLKAVDYIVKASLEPEILEKTLTTAIAEVNRRKKINQAQLVDEYFATNRQQIMQSAVKIFLTGSRFSQEYETMLEDAGIGQGFCVISLWFFPKNSATLENMEHLMVWQEELVEKLAQNFFKKFVITNGKWNHNLLILYWENQLSSSELNTFYDKIQAASANITNLEVRILLPGWFHGLKKRDACIARLSSLNNLAYLQNADMVDFENYHELTLSSLNVKGLSDKLKMAIHSKDLSVCNSIFHRINEMITTIDHGHSQVLLLCSEFLESAKDALNDLSSLKEAEWFYNDSTRTLEIHFLKNRNQVLEWFSTFHIQLEQILQSTADSQDKTIAKAKQYTLEHIHEKIFLEDAAKAINMSPAYFSSVFKKATGQSFIDYVNQLKCEQACLYIRQGQYRMNEISQMLGFENAYYFSKVFRKYLGMSPTEYQYQISSSKE